jgi:hypothetical protein
LKPLKRSDLVWYSDRESYSEPELERKRQIFEARMTILRAEIEVEEEVIQQSISELKLLDEELLQDRGQMV